MLIWTAMFFGAAMMAAWLYAKPILHFLLKPVEGQLSPFPGGPPVFTEPTGVFFVTIDLAFRSGLAIAIPILLVGLYNITPHLPTVRRKGLCVYLLSVLFLYAAGMWFVYYIMVPRGMGFLLSYGTDLAVPLVTINSYFNLLKNLMLAVPLAFELPVLMWIFARLKILTYRRMMKIRKFVPVGLAVFTAIITPTVDQYNFFIMYIPMLLLFESGMFLMWTVTPEQGNYLFLKTLNRWSSRIWSTITWPARVVRNAFRKVFRR